MESATDPLLYELDARGDITLTLNESTLEYEDDEDFFMAPALPASPYEIQRKRKRATLDLSRRLEGMIETKGSPGLPASSPLGLNLTMYGDDQPAEDPIYTQEPPAKGDEDKESVIQEDHASKPLPIRFLVSSKHLTLASPLFAAMLKPTWAEGAALYSQGTAVIPALSSSRDSLLLFLNVIHCRSRLIPQSIDIGQLCEIAQLADYYQSHDAFQFHFETWTQNSGNQPSELTRDSVRWLYISWVLKKRDLFTRVARVLHREAKAPLRVSKLSIPDTVIDRINKSREASIKSVIAGLYEIIDNIEDEGKRWCSYGCASSSLALSLTSHMRLLGLYPRPTAPYKGYSFTRLCTSLRYSEITDPYTSAGYLPHRCRIESEINLVIDDATRSIKRFSLDDYC